MKSSAFSSRPPYKTPLMPDQWYIKTTSGERGPYTMRQLQRYVEVGVLGPQAGVRDEDGKWVAAYKIQALGLSGSGFAKAQRFTAKGTSAVNRSAFAESVNSEAGDRTEQTSGSVTDGDSIDQLRSELQASQSKVAAKEEALQQQEEMLNERASTIEAQETQLQSLSDQCQDQERELEAKAHEIETKGHELEAKALELDAKTVELESKGQELESKAQELEARAKELESREQASQEQSNEELERLTEALAEQSQLRETAQSELAESRQSELEQRGQIESLETELRHAKELREQIAQQLEQAEKTHASESEGQSSRIIELQTELEERQSLIEEKAGLHDVQEAEWTSRLNCVQEELDALRREHAEADRQIADLNDQLEQANKSRHEALTNAKALTKGEPFDLILEEKRKLLLQFADRQESLSKREADLMRREEELTLREMDLEGSVVESSEVSSTSLVNDSIESSVLEMPSPDDAFIADPNASEVGESVANDEFAGESHLADTPAVHLLSEPSSLEENAEVGLATQHAVAQAPVASLNRWPAPKQSQPPTIKDEAEDDDAEDDDEVQSTVLNALREHRRATYDKRFGLCDRYLIDEDPTMRVDVSVHQPNEYRDFATLVTSGMSDYPIPMPSGQRSVRAEMLLYVAQVDDLSLDLIRAAAKVPFLKKQGLSIGTTFSLEDGGVQFPGTHQRDSVYMLPVVEADSKPISAKAIIGNSIQLFWLVTITEAERRLIETSGIHKFLALLEKNNHAVLFDPTRECYVRRKGWFRR